MRPPRGRSGGGFRGGRDGGGRGGRGGRGGGRFPPREEGPPSEVVEVSTFLHACEGDAVTKLTNEKIPYFNAPIYLANKTQIGKVDEIFGPINESLFSIKMMEGIVATSYSAGDKFFIDPAKLLPLARFLPQPKGQAQAARGEDVVEEEVVSEVVVEVAVDSAEGVLPEVVEVVSEVAVVVEVSEAEEDHRIFGCHTVCPFLVMTCHSNVLNQSEQCILIEGFHLSMRPTSQYTYKPNAERTYKRNGKENFDASVGFVYPKQLGRFVRTWALDSSSN
ncbi:UNVERIFIED_CONTAM: putative H/ACA ribonucleoprotein complex subunit-like protein 1 [Sesamum calycinum]|uniref:H/ACA ribonucleoprotein complex subunit n=1 Tax=Sesamum calycinum TaxID=2727403 RepID=A0AAW2N530_9LAMI